MIERMKPLPLPLHYIISRIKEIILYESHSFLVFRMIQFLLSPLGSLGMINLYEKDLTKPLRKTVAKIDILISQATPAQLEEISNLHGIWERQDRYSEFERYFDSGQLLCFIAKIGSEIVNYNWTRFHTMPTPIGPCFTSIPLMADEVFCQTAFTVEKWRGNNIHAAVLNHMLCFQKENGFHKAYTAVATYHKSSFKAHERTGWDLEAIILYFVLKGSNKTFIRSLRGNRECSYLKKILSVNRKKNANAEIRA